MMLLKQVADLFDHIGRSGKSHGDMPSKKRTSFWASRLVREYEKRVAAPFSDWLVLPKQAVTSRHSAQIRGV
jgi:hypothetical protein